MNRRLELAVETAEKLGQDPVALYLHTGGDKAGAVYAAPDSEGGGMAVVALVFDDTVILTGNWGEDIYPTVRSMPLDVARTELRYFCAGWVSQWDSLDVTEDGIVKGLSDAEREAYENQ